MPAPEPFTSRAWLIDVLDEAGRRLDLAAQAGAINPQFSWESDGITISVRSHGDGDGLTITTKRADGTTPIADLTVPAGWATS